MSIDRAAAARYGLNIADVQSLVSSAVGGDNVTETIEGLARFPVNLRYPREWRDTPQRLTELPLLTPMGQQITLGSVAKVSISDGPPMLKSENARPSGWVYVDTRGRDLASVANDLRKAVFLQVQLEPGMSIAYSGQFEYLERANERLKVVVPATLLIIFVLLYLTFSRFDEALLIMATLPFALTGGVVHLPDGVQPVDRHGRRVHRPGRCGRRVRCGDAAVSQTRLAGSPGGWCDAIARTRQRRHPRRRRIARAPQGHDRGHNPGRPGTHRLGHGHGVRGDEPNSRPIVGGMVTAPLLSLFIVPAVYALMRRRTLV